MGLTPIFFFFCNYIGYKKKTMRGRWCKIALKNNLIQGNRAS